MSEEEMNRVLEVEQSIGEVLKDYRGQWVAVEDPQYRGRWVSAEDHEVIHSSDNLTGILSITEKEDDKTLAIFRVPENLHLISDVF